MSEVYKSLELSAQTNIKFKDIDANKALSVMNKEFFIQPPSTVLVLKDVITMEEVPLKADGG